MSKEMRNMINNFKKLLTENSQRKENYLKLIQNEKVKETYSKIYDMFPNAYVSVSKEGGKENIYIEMDESREELMISQDEIENGKWEQKVKKFKNKGGNNFNKLGFF